MILRKGRFPTVVRGATYTLLLKSMSLRRSFRGRNCLGVSVVVNDAVREELLIDIPSSRWGVVLSLLPLLDDDLLSSFLLFRT